MVDRPMPGPGREQEGFSGAGLARELGEESQPGPSSVEQPPRVADELDVPDFLKDLPQEDESSVHPDERHEQSFAADVEAVHQRIMKAAEESGEMDTSTRPMSIRDVELESHELTEQLRRTIRPRRRKEINDRLDQLDAIGSRLQAQRDAELFASKPQGSEPASPQSDTVSHEPGRQYRRQAASELNDDQLRASMHRLATEASGDEAAEPVVTGAEPVAAVAEPVAAAAPTPVAPSVEPQLDLGGSDPMALSREQFERNIGLNTEPASPGSTSETTPAATPEPARAVVPDKTVSVDSLLPSKPEPEAQDETAAAANVRTIPGADPVVPRSPGELGAKYVDGNWVRPDTTITDRETAQAMALKENEAFDAADRTSAGVLVERANDYKSLLTQAEKLERSAKATRKDNPKRAEKLSNAAQLRAEAEEKARYAVGAAEISGLNGEAKELEESVKNLSDTDPKRTETMAKAAELRTKARGLLREATGDDAQVVAEREAIMDAGHQAAEATKEEIRERKVAGRASLEAGELDQVMIDRERAEAEDRSRMMEKELLKAASPNESSRDRTNRERLIQDIRSTRDQAANAADAAERQRQIEENEKYRQRFLDLDQKVQQIQGFEGVRSVRDFIRGDKDPMASKLVTEYLRSVGFQPEDEDKAIVLTRRDLLRRPKYIDRYFSNPKESDPVKRSMMYAARYDAVTGQLVRFDIVKVPLKEKEYDPSKISDRQAHRWQLKAMAEVSTLRKDTKEDTPKYDHKGKVRKWGQTVYAGILEEAGYDRSSAAKMAKKKVHTSFWERIWHPQS